MFVPLFNYYEGYENYTFCPQGNDSLRLQYWDENAYVCELAVSGPEDEISANTQEAYSKSVFEGGAAAAEKEGLVATGEEAEAKSKKRKAETKDSLKPKKVGMTDYSEQLSTNHNRLHLLIFNFGATVMRNFMVSQ